MEKEAYIEPVILLVLQASGDEFKFSGRQCLQIVCYSNKYNRLEKRCYFRSRQTGKSSSKLKTLALGDLEIIFSRREEITKILSQDPADSAAVKNPMNIHSTQGDSQMGLAQTTP